MRRVNSEIDKTRKEKGKEKGKGRDEFACANGTINTPVQKTKTMKIH